MIHGEKKAGKTTMLLQEKGSLFIEFDPKQPYSMLQFVCSDWDTFLAVLSKLETTKHSYRNLVIDRVDIMYELASAHVCSRLGVDHPTKLAYGKGWAAVKAEFSAAVLRTMRILPTRWICHSTWKEAESTDSDAEIQRLSPSLGSQADSVLTGLIDIVGAYTYVGKERVLIIEGSEEIVAGHRCDSEESPRFRTIDGRRVREIPLGNSPREAYEAFVNAFNNKQRFATIAERRNKVSGGKPKTA
jgi:hypothetical protein